METEKKTRRPRGQSARGDFEESKRAAKTFHDEHGNATRTKTEMLRAMRLARENAAPSDERTE